MEKIFAAGKYAVVMSEGNYLEALALLQALLILDKNEEIYKLPCLRACLIKSSQKKIKHLLGIAKRGKKFLKIFPAGMEQYVAIFSLDALFCFHCAGITELKDVSFLQSLSYVRKWQRENQNSKNKQQKKWRTTP